MVTRPASTRQQAGQAELDERFGVRELAQARGFTGRTVALSEALCIGASPDETCDGPECLTLLCYNTKLIAPSPRSPDMENKARAKEIVDRIADGGYDVALLQEVHVDRMAKIIQHGPVHYSLGHPTGQRQGGLLNAHGYEDAIKRRGLLTVSKWPIVHNEMHSFDKNPGTRNWGALYTIVDKQGQRYHIFNTHLWWDKHWSTVFTDENCEGYREDQRVRQDQLEDLARWIDGQGIDAGEPIIIAGDFNFGGPDDSRYARCKQGDLKGYRYFRDQVLGAIDLFAYLPTKRILDHVFFRNAPLNRCVSSITLLDWETGIDWASGPDLSDHDPLAAHFELTGG
jgi:endonuclease/exonuclease/phosphatase family metal-dependent hydrolase